MDPRLSASLEGRYAIDREIGRGGMATVYLARDVKHSRNVALKVLNPELGAVLGVERFLSEIRVTANLQHPNLLPLFDSGEVNGLRFCVMPYVEGESLRARYVGRYALTRPDGSKVGVRIYEENDALMFQQDGQAAGVKLASQGNDVFNARGPGRVAFDAVNGRAVGVVAGGGSRALEAVRVP